MKRDTRPLAQRLKGSRVRRFQAVPSMGFPKTPEQRPCWPPAPLGTQQEDGHALPLRGVTDLPLPNQGRAGGFPYELPMPGL